jgi:hypothetical protein
MADVVTLIEHLELLQAGEPLPGDELPYPGLGTRGAVRRNKASLRTSNLAIYAKVDPVPSRLACELFDNLDTILVALRYWRDRHAVTNQGGR